MRRVRRVKSHTQSAKHEFFPEAGCDKACPPDASQKHPHGLGQMQLVGDVVCVADTPDGGAERNRPQPVSQKSKLRLGTHVAVIQKQCAESGAGDQRMRVSGFHLSAYVVESRAVRRMEKRSSLVRQVVPDDEAGTTNAVEVLRALDEITRPRAPNPPVFYEVACFIFRRTEPVHQPGTDQVIRIKLYHILRIPLRFRVVPSRSQLNHLVLNRRVVSVFLRWPRMIK